MTGNWKPKTKKTTYQVKKAQTMPQQSLMHQNRLEQHRLWLSTSLGLELIIEGSEPFD